MNHEQQDTGLPTINGTAQQTPLMYYIFKSLILEMKVFHKGNTGTAPAP